jgi:hypothetical protein
MSNAVRRTASHTVLGLLVSSLALLGCSGVRGELEGAAQPADEIQFVERVDSGPVVEEVDSGTVTPAPFEFVTEEVGTGIEVAGADLYAARPLVLLFSVPTCPVCHVEGPKLANAAMQHPDVNFVVVHSQGTVSEVTTFIDDAGLSNLTNVKNVMDEDMTLWSRFAVIAQPYYILVDADGGLSSSMGALGDDGLMRAAQLVLGEDAPA